MMSKNVIWEFFKKSGTDPSEAQCNECSKLLSLGSDKPRNQTVSGLKRHLSSCHTNICLQFNGTSAPVGSLVKSGSWLSAWSSYWSHSTPRRRRSLPTTHAFQLLSNSFICWMTSYKLPQLITALHKWKLHYVMRCLVLLHLSDRRHLSLLPRCWIHDSRTITSIMKREKAIAMEEVLSFLRN